MEDLSQGASLQAAICVKCTLPVPMCLCQNAPDLSDFNLALLFHPREIEKRHSTGRLLSRCCGVQHHRWHRNNQQLPEIFQNHTLVYPSEDDNGVADVNNIPSKGPLLLIDGTWQQSRKMLRQSPWLAQLPKCHIPNQTSRYTLRRNQIDNGLSTLETVAHLIAARGDKQMAEKLVQFLLSFQAQYKKF